MLNDIIKKLLRIYPHGSLFRTHMLPKLLFKSMISAKRKLFRLLNKNKRQILSRIIANVWVAADDPQIYALLQTIPMLSSKYQIDFEYKVLNNTLNAWATPKENEIIRCIKDSSLFATVYNLQSPALCNGTNRTDVIRDLMYEESVKDIPSLQKNHQIFQYMDYIWGKQMNNSLPNVQIDSNISDIDKNTKELIKYGYYGW